MPDEKSVQKELHDDCMKDSNCMQLRKSKLELDDTESKLSSEKRKRVTSEILSWVWFLIALTILGGIIYIIVVFGIPFINSFQQLIDQLGNLGDLFG